jgi:hypothetical protein
MIRRSASAAAAVAFGADEESNPLETVANITDVMLVLAVALMLALITRYSVDLTSATLLDEQDLEPVEQDISEGAVISDAALGFEEVGTVYMDPQTGEKYILMD